MINYLKKHLGPIIIVVTFAIVIISGIVTGTLDDAITAVRNASPIFMIACVLCHLLYQLIDGFAIYIFLRHENVNLSLKECVFSAITGHYYSGITPGATGGYPMQVYYLTKNGVPVGVASSSIVSFFISWHLMRVVLITIIAPFYWNFIIDNLGSNWPFLLLGYAYNTALVIFWLLLSFTQKPVEWLMKAIYFVAEKLHLSKDPDKLLEGLNKTRDKFFTSMQRLKTHKGEIFTQMLLGGLHVIVLNSIIYLAYRGVGLSKASYGQILVMSLCQNISAAYMPTPGGSGAQEVIYSIFFGKLMDPSSLLAVMLIWRFMSYYLSLIIGALTNLLHRSEKN